MSQKLVQFFFFLVNHEEEIQIKVLTQYDDGKLHKDGALLIIIDSKAQHFAGVRYHH